MTVLLDIQGVQSGSHAERGIARYLLELATALERWHPGAVDRYLVNPDLAVPDSLEPLSARGRLRSGDRAEYGSASVYHVGSPVELDVPLSRLWPAWAYRNGLRLMTTLYDLIPMLAPDRYLRDPHVRGTYVTRLQLVRRAERVLAISPTTARDACEHLGLAPERVTMVGTGVSEHFKPPENRRQAFVTARSAVPGLAEGFLLYTGGMDARKNVDGLLEAYAGLPERVRDRHQLVVVCRVLPAERVAIDLRLAELRISDRVLITGFVPDAVLVALCQATKLFVFPSFSEGFGLPVAEALACGAPVVASRISALTDLVHEPGALFDPHDPRSIAGTIARSLSDESLRQRLRAQTLPEWATWRSVAERTATAYAAVAAKRKRSRRRARRRVAVVAPLPPARSGVADDSYRLIAALCEHCDVDAVADGEAQTGEAPYGVRVVGTRNFPVAEGLAGGYDRVFYCLGNSEFHIGALELLTMRPGIVIAHDVRLTGLYGWIARRRRELASGSAASPFTERYWNRGAAIASHGEIDFWEADRRGVLLAREAIAACEAYLVHSQHAAQLARQEASTGDGHKVHVIPFRFPSPDDPRLAAIRNGAAAQGGALVGTFGIVSPVKQIDKLLESWQVVVREMPGATLAIVGSDPGRDEALRLRTRAQELGIAGSVVQTGDLEEEEFMDWTARTDLAVQLRAASNGESSAVVAQCLAMGVPTIVTAIGSGKELPDEAVVKVSKDVTPTDLGRTILRLLSAPGRRAALADAGRALARTNSYERVARLLYERYVVS